MKKAETIGTNPDHTTVTQVRAWINSRGLSEELPMLECPACLQTVKTYPRKLNYSFTLPLLILYRDTGVGQHVMVSDYLSRTYPCALTTRLLNNWEWPKLCHWGLLEKHPGHRDDGSDRTGVYCVTELGEQFVLRQTQVVLECLMYNKRCIGIRPDAPLVWIDDTFKEYFDYSEMMAANLSDYLLKLPVPKRRGPKD